MMKGLGDPDKNPLLGLVIIVVLIPTFLLLDVIEDYQEFKATLKCE